ncbi:MAG: hypothetical protein HY287_10080 [Planctomycetes bacterium]|nr:hypothetical protein [Planctomycetota bacterium]MBI3834663.1 hypothetical protein [Planctomycetota bacterium]
MRRKSSPICGFAIICTACAAVLAADNFEITWFTIDGGGGKSTGGQFELQGTIGQPDAGKLAGGQFELTGGFWFALEPGDCNSDGGVNSFDFSTFGGCMTGPNGGSLANNCKCFEADGDGDLDLFDFADFQATFSE